MPHLHVNGTKLYYEDTGGPGEPVLFSHGLLWSTRLFDPQVAALSRRFRCIAYDHRGQGRSESPPGDEVSMETCYEDAVALIEKLELGACHFVGLSMGGFVGMRLGARRPDLLRTLTLLETSAEPEPPENVPKYKLLNLVARTLGPGAVTGPVMKIMFGKTFLEDPTRAHERNTWAGHLKANKRSIYKAVNGVIRRKAVTQELERIRTPTLVVVGEEDVATVPAKAEQIHKLIQTSRLVRLPCGGHSCTVEEPARVNAVIEAFLAEHTTQA